ncbi:MAG: hypothetical protein ACK4M1_06620 [Flavobacterium sp.]
MGRVSNKSESILSNEFLSDVEIIEILETDNQSIQTEKIKELKKDLHEFCVLILETFRNEKKNKH